MEIVSGTEPQGEHEVGIRHSHQVKLIRGKYRSIAFHRCLETTSVIAHMREFDSAERIIGGADASVSLSSAPLRALRQAAYASHVSPIHVSYLIALSEAAVMSKKMAKWLRIVLIACERV